MTKILLVEDDKTIVANLTEFLNNEGYIVRSVTGQMAAMNLLKIKKYIVSSVALIASVITVCLCVFSRGGKAKTKPEKQG